MWARLKLLRAYSICCTAIPNSTIKATELKVITVAEKEDRKAL